MKTDLRIIKTKKNLYDSLLSLMSTNEFENIKVSDICNKALVNRSTFYSHFNDKYELLYSLLSDLKLSLKEKVESNNNINNPKKYYMNAISLLLDHINENIHIYSMIVKNNKNSIIMDIFNNTLLEDINNNLKIKNKNIPISFVSDFYMGAVFNVGINYLKNPNKYSKEEILSYLDNLLPNNI